MRTNLHPYTHRFRLIGLFGLAASLVAAAHAEEIRGRLNESQKVAILEARRAASNEATAFVWLGDFERAEAILAGVSTAEPGSADWHMQLGREFTHITLRVSGRVPTETTVAVAQRAVQHLKLADTLTANAQIQVGARNLSGILYERFLGDPAAAKASYEAVLRIAPNSRGVAEKIVRIEAAERNHQGDETTGHR